jgi:hypothetical protein
MMICTHNISKLKKILKIQKYYLLRKSLRMPEIWIHMEIKITATVSSELELGQGVVHCGPQSFNHNLINMHNLTLNILDVISFSNWLSVKQNSAETAKSGIWVAYPYLNSWNKCFSSSKFYLNFHNCRPYHQEQFLFWAWGLIRPQLILKNRRLSLMVHTFQNLEDFEFNSRFRNSSTLMVC